MWNKWFDLLDGSYFVSNIQDYFGYINKKLEIVTDNLPITIFVKKTQKIEWHLKLKQDIISIF